MIRNPSKKQQKRTLELIDLYELFTEPAHSVGDYTVYNEIEELTLNNGL